MRKDCYKYQLMYISSQKEKKSLILTHSRRTKTQMVWDVRVCSYRQGLHLRRDNRIYLPSFLRKPEMMNVLYYVLLSIIRVVSINIAAI